MAIPQRLYRRARSEQMRLRPRDKRIDLALNTCIESKEHVSVGQLVLAAGLSRSRFTDLFYLQTGMLPSGGAQR